LASADLLYRKVLMLMSTKIVLAWLLKMKNPAILTAALYVVSFFLLLPYLVQWQLPVSNTLLVLLGMLLAVVLVAVLLNWAYVATMIFPIAAALFFFFLGWILYIIAPGVDALAQVVLAVLNGMIANVGAGGATQNITAIAKDATSIVNNVGQFMITIGAAIYIHAKTLVGKINWVFVKVC
jgi:hypothetical protein